VHTIHASVLCLTGEKLVRPWPKSREECIASVKAQCPSATIANMPLDVASFLATGEGFPCYCQTGDDFSVGAQCRVLGAFCIYSSTRFLTLVCLTGAVSVWVSCFFTGIPCSAGKTGPGDGDCTACEAGKFKAESGFVDCTACPAHSSSPAGSTAATACRCNEGFSGPDGGMCNPIVITTSTIMPTTTPVPTSTTTTPIPIITTPAPEEEVIKAVLYFATSPEAIIARQAEFEEAVASASDVSRM